MEQSLSTAVQHMNLSSDSLETRSVEKEEARKNGDGIQNRRNRKANDNRNGNRNQTDELDYIPTAVVIKNIPFSVKRELLLDIFAHLGLPTPFALNYHLDNGVFRGLAFANFHTPEDTALVVNSIRGVELCGRKLRIEYKKHIGTDRREEYNDYAPQQAPQKQDLQPEVAPPEDDLDFSDLQTRVFFEQISSFYDDTTRAALIYPPTLDGYQRKLIHGIAERFGLYHFSQGVREERHIRVSKSKPQSSQPQATSKLPARRNGNGPSRANGEGFNSDRLYDPEYSSPRPNAGSKPFKKMQKPSDSLAVYPVRQPLIPDLKNNFASRKAELGLS